MLVITGLTRERSALRISGERHLIKQTFSSRCGRGLNTAPTWLMVSI
jgi:hypothetical protein